jgi:hypothetical protein
MGGESIQGKGNAAFDRIMNQELIETILRRRYVRHRGIHNIFLERSIATVFVFSTRLRPIRKGVDVREKLERELKTYYPQLKSWCLTWVEKRHGKITDKMDTVKI